MALRLRCMIWACSIGLGSALPLYTRQTNDPNSHSATIIAPVVVVAVVCAMLVGFGWWKRRKRTRELIQQLQTPATNNNNSTNNATTQTTPAAGTDAPARPPRRRRRRRPSQISTKSLPAYNEQAGDEEIVLVRRAERQSESEDDDTNENENDDPRQPTSQPDSRPLLDDDSSPDMPRVSLASSSRGRSLNEHPDQPPQSRTQSQLGHEESIANTTTAASSIADTEPEPEREPEPEPEPHPNGDVPSYTEVMSTSHVNLPTTATETTHTPQPSTSTADDSTTPSDPTGTVRPKRKSVFRHLGRFHISKPSGSSTPPPDAVEMTTTSPRPSTSTHRPSNSISTTQHRPSPSLSSLSLILTRSQSPTLSRTSLNISAPISTTLVRTELSYPRAGPTPEQIRFLSSRESLGRFGKPYGEDAIAAARSRDNLPPLYQPRVDTIGASGSGNVGTNTTGNGPNPNEIQTHADGGDDDPTVTIRRGPIVYTPGELAQRKTSENAASGGTDDRPDPDPTTTIREEPKAIREQSMPVDEDSKSIHEEPEAIQEVSVNVQEPGLDTHDTNEQIGDIQVEPRARESPLDNPTKDTRRQSVITTHSFVTATEGQRDSSPPTPTAETYHAARGQTVLIPQSREALHPELTLVPATPIG